MNPAANKIWLVILLGAISTIQIHLAKALERQGIDALDIIAKKSKRRGQKGEVPRKNYIVYFIGLLLNNTVFIYHLFIVPLGGTTAVYTSMYGVGLLVLLLYSAKVLKEPLSRQEWIGALAIFLGTTIIGIEGLRRPPFDMGWIDFNRTIVLICFVLVFSAILIYISFRNGSKHIIALGFGFGAGIFGALDPLLKGIGQTHGGGSMLVPLSTLGWIVFVTSYIIGFISFLIVQWGFYLRTRANILVPMYNASYIALPVIVQVMLLPGYSIYLSTVLGLGFIIFGFIILGNKSALLYETA